MIASPYVVDTHPAAPALGPLARALKFGRNIAADVAACPGLLDKCAVAVADAERIAAVLSEAAFGRPVPRKARGPFRDVVVENRDGRFHCRRGTSDYSIVRLDYEAALRDYFSIEGGVFVDVGAHIGKYTVSVARTLGSGGRVVAIEPDPANFESLRRNIAANDLRNVEAFELACGNIDGDGLLHLNPSESILHSLKGEGPGIPISIRRLDAILAGAGHRVIDLLKVDAEGVEREVLEGARETLRNSPNVRIVIEANDDAPLDWLREEGFLLTRTAHAFGRNGWYYTAARPGVG